MSWEIEREPIKGKSQRIQELVIQLSDANLELTSLREKQDNYLQQLLDTRHELIQKDYMVQNQNKRIEDLGKTLVRYEKENKALRELVGLWI